MHTMVRAFLIPKVDYCPDFRDLIKQQVAVRAEKGATAAVSHDSWKKMVTHTPIGRAPLDSLPYKGGCFVKGTNGGGHKIESIGDKDRAKTCRSITFGQWSTLLTIKSKFNRNTDGVQVEKNKVSPSYSQDV